MERLSRIHLVFLAALGLAMSESHAASPDPNVAGFDIGGLILSMPFDQFRRLFPEAEVTEKTAARYCYGKEVRIDSLTRIDAVIRRGNATVYVTFDQKYFGHVISAIKRDEVIEFDQSRFTSLRDGLVRLYGPYTGLKFPKKMEPAGLVVGFDWQQKGVAYLSVTIHRDHANDSGLILQTTFLTRSLPGMESHGIAAAYYRDTVQNFRESCALRSAVLGRKETIANGSKRHRFRFGVTGRSQNIHPDAGDGAGNDDAAGHGRVSANSISNPRRRTHNDK